MDLRTARHIVCLARHLSYTRAAEELGLTQSALSRSIQQVERASAVRLFDRDRGGVHLTTLGRAVVEQASALLREAEELDGLLERAAIGLQDEIAFGMAPLVATVLLPPAMADELQKHPELHSRVLVRPPDALLPLLLAGEIEFLVCVEEQLPPQAPIKASPIGWARKGYVVRAGHPLLQPGCRARYSDYPWIIGSTYTREVMHGRDALPDLRPEAQLILDDLGCLARITEQSDAIWVTSPEAAAREVMEKRLQELPIPNGGDASRFRIMLYHSARRSLSPAALRILGNLRKVILNNHHTHLAEEYESGG